MFEFSFTIKGKKHHNILDTGTGEVFYQKKNGEPGRLMGIYNPDSGEWMKDGKVYKMTPAAKKKLVEKLKAGVKKRKKKEKHPSGAVITRKKDQIFVNYDGKEFYLVYDPETPEFDIFDENDERIDGQPTVDSAVDSLVEYVDEYMDFLDEDDEEEGDEAEYIPEDDDEFGDLDIEETEEEATEIPDDDELDIDALDSEENEPEDDLAKELGIEESEESEEEAIETSDDDDEFGDLDIEETEEEAIETSDDDELDIDDLSYEEDEFGEIEDEEGEPKVGDIIWVGDKPQKSRSSSGNWAVPVKTKVPFGNGETEGFEYFFKKKEAENWIQEMKTKLESVDEEENEYLDDDEEEETFVTPSENDIFDILDDPTIDTEETEEDEKDLAGELGIEDTNEEVSEDDLAKELGIEESDEDIEESDIEEPEDELEEEPEEDTEIVSEDEIEPLEPEYADTDEPFVSSTEKVGIHDVKIIRKLSAGKNVNVTQIFYNDKATKTFSTHEEALMFLYKVELVRKLIGASIVAQKSVRNKDISKRIEEQITDDYVLEFLTKQPQIGTIENAKEVFDYYKAQKLPPNKDVSLQEFSTESWALEAITALEEQGYVEHEITDVAIPDVITTIPELVEFGKYIFPDSNITHVLRKYVNIGLSFEAKKAERRLTLYLNRSENAENMIKTNEGLFYALRLLGKQKVQEAEQVEHLNAVIEAKGKLINKTDINLGKKIASNNIDSIKEKISEEYPTKTFILIWNIESSRWIEFRGAIPDFYTESMLEVKIRQELNIVQERDDWTYEPQQYGLILRHIIQNGLIETTKEALRPYAQGDSLEYFDVALELLASRGVIDLKRNGKINVIDIREAGNFSSFSGLEKLYVSNPLEHKNAPKKLPSNYIIIASEDKLPDPSWKNEEYYFAVIDTNDALAHTNLAKYKKSGTIKKVVVVSEDDVPAFAEYVEKRLPEWIAEKDNPRNPFAFSIFDIKQIFEEKGERTYSFRDKVIKQLVENGIIGEKGVNDYVLKDKALAHRTLEILKNQCGTIELNTTKSAIVPARMAVTTDISEFWVFFHNEEISGCNPVDYENGFLHLVNTANRKSLNCLQKLKNAEASFVVFTGEDVTEEEPEIDDTITVNDEKKVKTWLGDVKKVKAAGSYLCIYRNHNFTIIKKEDGWGFSRNKHLEYFKTTFDDVTDAAIAGKALLRALDRYKKRTKQRRAGVARPEVKLKRGDNVIYLHPEGLYVCKVKTAGENVVITNSDIGSITVPSLSAYLLAKATAKRNGKLPPKLFFKYQETVRKVKVNQVGLKWLCSPQRSLVSAIGLGERAVAEKYNESMAQVDKYIKEHRFKGFVHNILPTVEEVRIVESSENMVAGLQERGKIDIPYESLLDQESFAYIMIHELIHYKLRPIENKVRTFFKKETPEAYGIFTHKESGKKWFRDYLTGGMDTHEAVRLLGRYLDNAGIYPSIGEMYGLTKWIETPAVLLEFIARHDRQLTTAGRELGEKFMKQFERNIWR